MLVWMHVLDECRVRSAHEGSDRDPSRGDLAGRRRHPRAARRGRRSHRHLHRRRDRLRGVRPCAAQAQTRGVRPGPALTRALPRPRPGVPAGERRAPDGDRAELPGTREAGRRRHDPDRAELLPGPRDRRGAEAGRRAAQRRSGRRCRCDGRPRPRPIPSMTAVVAALVPVVVAAALLVAGLVLLVTRQVATALPVLLDLLLAAGLLRLSATASWQAIASAAAIVLLRKLVALGLAAARRARAEPASA